MRHLVAVLRSLGVKNFDRGRISGLFQQSGQAGQMDQRQRSKNGLGEVSPGGSEIILFGSGQTVQFAPSVDIFYP